MKKLISFVRSYLGHAGAYFMLTMLVFGVVALATDSATVNLRLIWTALLFGVLVALCDYIFVCSFLGSYLAKVVFHGILTVASFAVSFVWVSGLIERGKTAVFGVLFFAVFYVILAVIRCVYHFAGEKKANAKKEYHSLYTPKDVD